MELFEYKNIFKMEAVFIVHADCSANLIFFTA